MSNKQGRPARCWLTSCSKHRAYSCQQQAGRASQMLTYILFKTQSMLLSATSSKGQQDANLQPVQNREHALVSNKEKRPARCWLTSYSKPRECSGKQQGEKPVRCWLISYLKPSKCSGKQQGEKASQMLTYILFKTQSTFMSPTRRKGQTDADLHPIQNPEHIHVTNKQERPSRC